MIRLLGDAAHPRLAVRRAACPARWGMHGSVQSADVSSRGRAATVSMTNPISRPLVFARADARPFAGRAFGVLPEDLDRHVYVLGRTGTGKTTLLEHLLVALVRRSEGCALLDPHGDLADRLLNFIPRSRWNDVVLVDPADATRPVGLNVLAHGSAESRALLVSGVLAVFKKAFPDSWGPRTEHVLRNALLAASYVRGATLLSVSRLLVDTPFRASVLRQCTDPVVLAFFTTEFERYPPRFLAEVIAPVQNKLAAALTHPSVRRLLGQHRATVRVAEVMDEGKILVANLSRGRLGEDASQFLGGLLVTELQLAAYARAHTAPPARRPFTVVLDEFEAFVTPSVGMLLAEARKYRVGLVLAHQHLGQLDEGTRRAVLGNVGTTIVFRVGGEDAQLLAEDFAPEMGAEDLTRLARHQVALRLAVRGDTTRPFTAQVLPPDESLLVGGTDVIRRVSAERYGRDVARVDAQIDAQLPGDVWHAAKHSRATPGRDRAGETLPLL